MGNQFEGHEEEVAEAAAADITIILNAATCVTAHPATALTALQHAVARTLETYNVPSSVFMERVDEVRKRLRNDPQWKAHINAH